MLKQRKFRALLSLLVVLTMLLSACAQTTGPTNPPNNPGSPSNSEPYIVKGVATDNSGAPLAGVKVVANNTQFYDANVVGYTDAQGRYRLELRAGSWQMTASMMREYNGETYLIELTPDNDAPFAGSEGAVRNFVWQTAGGEAGQGSVFVYSDITVELLDYRYIELTLEPQGPLLDGSPGQTITAMIEPHPDGDGLTNVPIGRYRISARYLPPGEAPVALEIKPRQGGSYADSLVADFERPYGSGLDIYWIEVMVKRKGS